MLHSSVRSVEGIPGSSFPANLLRFGDWGAFEKIFLNYVHLRLCGVVHGTLESVGPTGAGVI